MTEQDGFLDQVGAAWRLKWRFEKLKDGPCNMDARCANPYLVAQLRGLPEDSPLLDAWWSEGMVGWVVDAFMTELLAGRVPTPRTEPFDLGLLDARHFGTGWRPPRTG